ncbi:hypothetical protein HH310_23780 [Actinoplanes sp. TBRC 11911]|uniref:hypothetical protein n=1 Tax=Actinoplanes sp. TBRC 11911 TaxID=2729386 RepID=UPI00145E1AAD|nr:hypothetical protein [Actinoplanes sp. TBRC 11911]NMO54191.1 hypothetical protein [Actinoplanes sp. TBRC 11911]
MSALIDLGEIPRELAAGPVETRSPFPSKVVLGALSLVLLTLLTGAMHRAPQRPPTIVAARLGDLTFITEGQLAVVSAGRPVLGSDVANRVVTTYALPAGRMTSRTSVAVSGGVTWVWRGAGVILVSYQVDSTGTWAVVAAAEGTERTLWRREARWIGASAADGLVVLSADDAELGLDLSTGRVRWSVPHPPDGYTTAVGDGTGWPSWLVTLTDSGGLETRDPHTGKVVAALALSSLPGRQNGLMWAIDGLIVVQDGDRGFDAYHVPGLDKAWTTTADLSQSWTDGDCGRLMCAFRMQRGLSVVDSATGRFMWSAERWAYAEAAGGYLLAAEPDRDIDDPAVWVLDPDTGRVLGDFGRWEARGRASDGTVYGTLDVPDTHRMFYGVLDPATRHVRILGSGTSVSGSCEIGPDVLLCRLLDASIALWPLR